MAVNSINDGPSSLLRVSATSTCSSAGG